MASAPPSIASEAVVIGAPAFGPVVLLRLVTEERIVEAHDAGDTPRATALFLVGFLALPILEDTM